MHTRHKKKNHSIVTQEQTLLSSQDIHTNKPSRNKLIKKSTFTSKIIQSTQTRKERKKENNRHKQIHHTEHKNKQIATPRILRRK